MHENLSPSFLLASLQTTVDERLDKMALDRNVEQASAHNYWRRLENAQTTNDRIAALEAIMEHIRRLNDSTSRYPLLQQTLQVARAKRSELARIYARKKGSPYEEDRVMTDEQLTKLVRVFLDHGRHRDTLELVQLMEFGESTFNRMKYQLSWARQLFRHLGARDPYPEPYQYRPIF